MSKDDIRLILKKNRAEEGRVYISGIHYFTGTQRTKLKHQKEELKMLKEFITGLRREFDIELPKLEYGPGLPYPYFEKDDFSDTLLPLKELSDDLNETAKWSSLTVEMGRFLSSSAGYYITRTVDIKTSFDKTWVILDGGINHVNYLGQMLGMMVPKMLHIQDGKALIPIWSYADRYAPQMMYLSGIIKAFLQRSGIYLFSLTSARIPLPRQ